MKETSAEQSGLPAWLGLSALTLAALALRLFRIDARSIWLDEAYSLRLAAEHWRGIVQGARMDIHPPLFHLLLHGWIKVFGTSEIALRSFSAVLGALLVAAVFKLAETLAGRRAAWWAAALTAVSPYFIELSRTGRMGALLALCLVLSVYFFVQVIRGRSLGFAAGYFASTLAAMYTHYFAFLVVFAQVFYLFMGIKQLRLSRTTRLRWFYLELFLLAGYAPWLSALWTHALKGGPSWRGAGAGWLEPLHSGYAFFMGTACWTVADKIIAVGALALALAWLVRSLSPAWARAYALMAPRDWGLILSLIAVPVLLVLLYSRTRLNVFDNRYLSLSAAMTLIALGGGLSLLSRRQAAVPVLLLALAFAVPVRNQYWACGYYDDWRTAASALMRAEAPPDRVAVYPAWNETPLQYYLSGRLPVRGLPGTYDPISGETADYFPIDHESVDHLQSHFASDRRICLLLVGEGEPQDALRGWFSAHYRLRREQRLGAIGLGWYERPDDRSEETERRL